MVKHWIITNRQVVTSPQSGREHVVDLNRHGDRIEALPTFRVAEFKFDKLPAKPSQTQLDAAVEFVPDTFEPGYESLGKNDKAQKLPGSQQLFKSLYDSMSSAKEGKGDTLFFIHGFNYAWNDSLAHLHRLIQLYAVPEASKVSQIVYFTWPSWGALRKYWKDQQIAAPSGQLLGRVFGKLVRFYADFFDPAKRKADRPQMCGRRIHIAAHSMGNQVLREFMRSIVQYDYLHHPVFGEALLLNADVEWTALNPGEPLHELATFSDRVHVYNHFSDDALRHSSLVKNPGEKRLGQYGPISINTNILPPRTLIADCSSIRSGLALPTLPSGTPSPAATPPDLRKLATSALHADPAADPLAVAARVLDRPKAAMKERMIDHWGYLHRPEVVADIWQVLAGKGSAAIDGRTQTAPGPLYRLRDV